MPSGFYGELNVKMFGAKGDGVTDDTAAINLAIATLSQENGGILFFPAGIYIISSSLVMSGSNNVTFRGSGVTCTQLARATGFAGATFSSLTGVVRCRDISLADFNIGGSNTPPGVPATTVALTNPFPFRCMVYITGGTVTVIAIGGTTTGLISGAFSLAVNQTITLTYSAAPTWTWFGAEG